MRRRLRSFAPRPEASDGSADPLAGQVAFRLARRQEAPTAAASVVAHAHGSASRIGTAIASGSVYHGLGVTLPRPAILTLSAGLAGAAAGVAALAARSTWDPPALVLALTIVAVPALVLLAAEWPAAALGVFVAAQVLEAFEYPTAVGTVSFGVILLGLLLLFHWRSVLDTIHRDRYLLVATVLFGGWVATFALRVRYEPASSAAREVVTVLGFGAYAAAGIAVARCRNVIRNMHQSRVDDSRATLRIFSTSFGDR